MRSTIRPTYSVARGVTVGRFTPSPSMALNQIDSHLVVMSCHGRPSR